LLQALLQQTFEQWVKAIPLLVLVEGDNEDVRALQPVQACLYMIGRGIPVDGRGTQLGAERIQNRGPQEKLLDGRSLLAEDFLHQVSAHRAVRLAAQVFHKRRRVRGAAQREGRQAQERNPALRSFLQWPGGLTSQVVPKDAGEKGQCLLVSKAQVGA